MRKIVLDESVIVGDALVTNKENYFVDNGFMVVRAFSIKTGVFHDVYCMEIDAFPEPRHVIHCLNWGIKASKVLRLLDVATRITD